MKTRKGWTSKEPSTLHPTKRIVFLAALILVTTSISPRAITAVRANSTCLGILRNINPELNWVKYGVEGKAQIESERPTDTTTTPIWLLSSWHFDRHREGLGRFFLAIELVYNQRDEEAIAEFQNLGGSGVLWSIGAELEKSGNRYRAIQYLEAAAELAPHSYYVLQHLSAIYLAEKKWCDLLRVASRGVGRYGSGLFYYYLGRAYEGLGAWQQATAAYEQALQRRPGYEPYVRLWKRSIEAALLSPPVDTFALCRERQ